MWQQTHQKQKIKGDKCFPFILLSFITGRGLISTAFEISDHKYEQILRQEGKY